MWDRESLLWSLVLLLAFFLWFLILLPGCGGSKKTVKPPIKVDITAKGCLDDVGPAPELRPIVLVAGGALLCPEDYEFCAEYDAALALAEYLEAARLWAKRVEIACGNEPDVKPTASLWIHDAVMPRSGTVTRVER